MERYKLGDIATVEISGVDKKKKEGEKKIRLCNFVDVYYNWAITMAQYDSFMFATARLNEISAENGAYPPTQNGLIHPQLLLKWP